MDVHFSPVVSLPMLPKDSSDIKESMKHRTYGLFALASSVFKVPTACGTVTEVAVCMKEFMTSVPSTTICVSASKV